MKNESHIIIYQASDGKIKLQVKFEGETAWLNQAQIAELFQKSIPTINEHIKNAYKEGELEKKLTIRKFRIVQKEGSRDISREIEHYNLDVIISVGYRVKSVRGTQFRIWATQRLKEYIIKGFALDDERLKQGGDKSRYFDELLQRIRDIRSSERNFYQKVTDIYATSIDYRNNDKLTQQFFASVQNKMHYAVHGKTAAEIIATRASSSKALMGLTSFKGSYLTATDVMIAKNYLTEVELKQLNLIVSLYLDFAELQATNKRPMIMRDWITKLDEFLKLSERQILTDVGKINAKEAQEKARAEFIKFKRAENKKYFSDFDKAEKKLLRKAENKTLGLNHE